MKKEKNFNSKNIKIILWSFTIIFVFIEVYVLFPSFFPYLPEPRTHYKWDFIFIMLLLWVVYIIRDRIKLHPFHYSLFAIFLLAHDFGAFNAYNFFPLGLEYDFWVHTYFGVVSSLILYRTYNLVGPYKGWFKYVAIIAIVLGFSAFHELFEYAGALTVGEGEGVLFVGAGDLDEWDTQKDMRNNLIGALIGLALYFIYNLIKIVKKK